MEVSQRKLNCALPNSGLAAWVLVSLIEIFSRSDNNPETGRVSAGDGGRYNVLGKEKVRSTDAIAASVSNFGDESAEIHRLTFLTESLILAQNERWRRG